MVVSGEYEVGMQDQAFLGPESGLAVPDGEGGVDLYIATQWLHVDRDQLAESLGLPPEKVRLTMAGVGGAFGGREDLSMQVHACLLALHTDRPVKMSTTARSRSSATCTGTRQDALRARRHRDGQARLRAGAGRARRRRLRVELDRRVLERGVLRCGPYDVPSATVDAYVVYTNNPPCGAMRGFGAVQTAFAHEAQMDKLAAALGMDPVDLRIRNAMAPGQRLITGQVIPAPAPVAELLERLRDIPLPPPAPAGRDLRDLPGGVSTPPTARASCAASATASGSRTWATPRASTTTRPRT